jgi:hypothetical protein
MNKRLFNFAKTALRQDSNEKCLQTFTLPNSAKYLHLLQMLSALITCTENTTSADAACCSLPGLPGLVGWDPTF